MVSIYKQYVLKGCFCAIMHTIIYIYLVYFAETALLLILLALAHKRNWRMIGCMITHGFTSNRSLIFASVIVWFYPKPRFKICVGIVCFAPNRGLEFGRVIVLLKFSFSRVLM